MDEAMGKLGIYDFFSVLVSGVIFSTACLFTGVPERYILYIGGGDTVATITFLIWSGFIGLVLVGIGSIYEKCCPWSMLKNNARKKIFTGKVFENTFEQERIDEMGRAVLKKSKEEILDEKDSQYVHDYCVAYLQTHGKDTKIEQIGAMAGLYRSLMVAFFLQMVLHRVVMACDDYANITNAFMPKMIAFLLLMFFFGFRAQQMAKYRIRTVLRHYQVLNKDTINGYPGAESSAKQSA